MYANSIQLIQNPDDSLATSFHDIANARVDHFKDLYKENQRETINHIIQVSILFHSFVTPKKNEWLMDEITKEELEFVIKSFQNDKFLV